MRNANTLLSSLVSSLCLLALLFEVAARIRQNRRMLKGMIDSDDGLFEAAALFHENATDASVLGEKVKGVNGKHIQPVYFFQVLLNVVFVEHRGYLESGLIWRTVLAAQQCKGKIGKVYFLTLRYQRKHSCEARQDERRTTGQKSDVGLLTTESVG